MADARRLNQCPQCGSTALDRGRMSQETRFFRAGSAFSFGWELEACVCLDCGLLTPCLGTAELDQLRAEKGLAPRGA